MTDAILQIGIIDAGGALEDGMTTEEMLLAAMKRARRFWLSTDDDLRLRAAVGAVLSKLGKEHPDHQKLVHSIETLRMFGTMIAAMQAGLRVEQPEDLESPAFPLIGLWQESAKE